MRNELYELKSFLSQQSGRADVNKKVATLKGFEGLSKHGFRLREWKINRSGRIVFTDGQKLGLVAFALDHTAVEALGILKNSELLGLVESFQELPQEISSSLAEPQRQGEPHAEYSPKDFESGGQDRSIIAEEYFPDWYSHVFDSKQLSVVDALVSQISKEPRTFKERLIIGGAGTGKTSVLLAIADRLSQERTISVELRLPRMVRQMLLAHPDYQWIKSLKSGVVLLDDPADLGVYESAVRGAKSLGVPIVTAIDPTQWRERKARRETRKIIERSQVHKLTLQYRQGGLIGKYVFGQLSFFFSKVSGFMTPERKAVEQEIASAWEQLCLRDVEHFDNEGNIAFLDFSGVEEDAEAGAKEIEPIKMLVRFEGDLLPEIQKAMDWNTDRNWPKLLIGTYSKKSPPNMLEAVLDDEKIIQKGQYHFRSFSDQADIRGTEYESVLVFLNRHHWMTLSENPPEGLGSKGWVNTTNVLTFLTRAENRLIICVLPDRYFSSARDEDGYNKNFDEPYWQLVI